MSRTVVAVAIVLSAQVALTTAALAERDVVLSESFEGEPEGWRLVLNRGAEATMTAANDAALGARSVRIAPSRLAAPDDRELVTNIHLRYETIPLRANTPYRLSVWMRAAAPKLVGLKVRRRDVEESVAWRPVEVTNRWRRYEFSFELPEDYPDGTPQICLAEDTTAVWVDALTIVEHSPEDLAPADYMHFGEELSGPSASLVRLVSDFDEGTDGWRLRLNRGAEAEMVRESGDEGGSIRVSPTALSAPHDTQYPTNVHIYADSVPLRAGREYVFSARLRSDRSRAASLRLRAADDSGARGGPEFELGETWQRHEWAFTLDEDMPEAVPQVLLGYDLSPVWIDDVMLCEAGLGDQPQPPEGCIERGDRWLRPEVIATGASRTGPLAGLTELATDLPEALRMHLAIDMLGAEALRLVLGTGEQEAVRVDIAADGVTIGDGPPRPINAGGWRSGEAVTLSLERLGGEARVIVGETTELVLPATEFDRAWIGAADPGRGIHLLAAEGYEMLPTARPDGTTEREEFTDPLTGRRIVRLTHSPYNDKHAYYDISPWSPDGSKIVFSSALPGERDATISMMDADGTNIRALGHGDSFGMHTGAFPIWDREGLSVYYHTHFENADGERVGGTARVWLDRDRVDQIPIPVRQVSRATGRLLWMENSRAEDAPERGLYSAAADGSDLRLLFPTADIEALSPSRDRHDQCETLGLTNCKWSPDGQKVMVVLVGYNDRGAQLVKEIYIANADGGDLHFVMTFQHHHIWHPNSEQVIGNCSDGLYIVNADGTGRRKISDLAQGHPSFSPDGSMIVTDCYGGDYADMLVLIDPETGEVEPLCSVPTVHGRSHETGTHPHPCWAPDGRSILYDSDQEGHCQLYQVFVDRQRRE